MMLADLEAGEQNRVDVEKVVRMAILHDLAESLTFDINQAYLSHMGNRGQAIKREVEDKAWSHLLRQLGNSRLARGYTSLQREYEAAITKESKIVHAADSLDLLLQVLDYVHRGYPRRLVADLWQERRKMVSRCGVPSAKRVLALIAREYEKLG
jgi:putative hydrolase of HD superfamily